MTLLWICAVQTTVMLLFAIAILPFLRKRSAALRHCVLASALIFSAALPAFNLLMPSWSVPESLSKVIPKPPATRFWQDSPRSVASATPDTQNVVSGVQKTATSITPGKAGIGIWAIGAVSGLTFLIVGLIRLARLASHARPIGTWSELGERISTDYRLPRPVRLLHSENPSILVTWGIARPKVILPQSASTWTADVATSVLRHEFAHIRRGDWVVQMLAQSLRIVYWFNPLIWFVCRRLRLEAELACDDAVLVRNISGHEYASHLLGLARSLNTTDRAWSAVLTMARPSTLERRFTAMLNPALNRNPLTRAAVLVTLLIGLGITASLPAMKTFAAEPAPPQQTRTQAPTPVPAMPVVPGQAAPVRLPEAVPQTEIEIPGLAIELKKNFQDVANTLQQIQIDPIFGVPRPSVGMSGESTEMLIKLFDGSNDVEMKKHILAYLGMSNNPKASEKVLSIARSNNDKELQQEAIGYLSLRPNAFDDLVTLYDTSRDPETKRSILESIGMSRDTRATQKLFTIAQSDADPELRRVAVDYIAFR